MPLTSVLIVTGIVAVFVLFALSLAWGEYQTRNLPRYEASDEKQDQKDAELKKAA